MGEEEGASLDPPLQPSGSPTFQPPNSPPFQPPNPTTDFDASIQKTNLNSFQAEVETQMGEEREFTQEGNLKCTNCQKTFTEHSNIRKHIGPFHAKEMFYCTDCTESPTGRDQSSTHVVKHEGAKDFKCEAFGPGKADIGRASRKLDTQVEVHCKRKKTHGTDYFSKDR